MKIFKPKKNLNHNTIHTLCGHTSDFGLYLSNQRSPSCLIFFTAGWLVPAGSHLFQRKTNIYSYTCSWFNSHLSQSRPGFPNNHDSLAMINNPLSPNSNLHILLYFLHTFLMLLVERICTNIKTFHVW